MCTELRAVLLKVFGEKRPFAIALAARLVPAYHYDSKIVREVVHWLDSLGFRV